MGRECVCAVFMRYEKPCSSSYCNLLHFVLVTYAVCCFSTCKCARIGQASGQEHSYVPRAIRAYPERNYFHPQRDSRCSSLSPSSSFLVPFRPPAIISIQKTVRARMLLLCGYATYFTDGIAALCRLLDWCGAMSAQFSLACRWAAIRTRARS